MIFKRHCWGAVLADILCCMQLVCVAYDLSTGDALSACVDFVLAIMVFSIANTLDEHFK